MPFRSRRAIYEANYTSKYFPPLTMPTHGYEQQR